MLKVALTGGIATGKSHVGKVLEELGCHLIQADALGHQALLPDGEAYAPVVAIFGEAILGKDRKIDRRKLAALVFDDTARLEQLNAIVHPAVERLRQAATGQIVERDPHPIVVVEAAIHIETGGYRNYGKLILVVCSEEEQIRRAMLRDNVSEAEVLARIRRQMPLGDKRKFADYVIDSSGSFESTRRQTEAVYNLLRSLESSL